MKTNKGFAPIFVLILLVVAGVGAIVYVSFKDSKLTTNLPSQTPTTTQPTGSPIPDPKSAKSSPPTKAVVTAKPTPTPKVNNSYCGTYDSVSRPPLPARGNAPLYEVIYPVGGIASGHFFYGWQLDYDGDGNWDTGNLQVNPNDPNSGHYIHTYSANGAFNPKFRIVATDGTVGPTCSYPFNVVVGGSPAYQNDVIAVDKLDIEFTVSKSKSNYQFPWYEENLTNAGDRIYIPGINVSAKENFTSVVFKNSWNGIYSSGASINPGTSSNINFIINKSSPAGIYEGTNILTYTTGPNGTVTKDGPTIHYKITLTD